MQSAKATMTTTLTIIHTFFISISPPGIQDEDAQNWNPYTGKEYGPHPALSTRITEEYGTAVGRSQASPLCLPDSPRRRSKRVNRSSNPVTIDILSSDSEDDNSAALEEQDDSVESKVNNEHACTRLCLLRLQIFSILLAYFVTSSP